MKARPATITPAQIRRLHNSYLDGTINDAIGRHLCHVALGECCVGDKTIPGGMRYPTEDEIREAKERLAQSWNIRFHRDG
jgi:hypothetical protein